MADQVREVEVQLADNEIVPAKLFIWDEAPENRDLVKLILQFTGKEISSNGLGLIFDTGPDVIPAVMSREDSTMPARTCFELQPSAAN